MDKGTGGDRETISSPTLKVDSKWHTYIRHTYI